MRNLSLIVLAALSLAACGSKEAAEETSASAQNITAESIGANDTTAIDAALSADANMAADVEFNAEDLEALNEASNNMGNAG